jgi:hypothetical protein
MPTVSFIAAASVPLALPAPRARSASKAERWQSQWHPTGLQLFHFHASRFRLAQA